MWRTSHCRRQVVGAAGQNGGMDAEKTEPDEDDLRGGTPEEAWEGWHGVGPTRAMHAAIAAFVRSVWGSPAAGLFTGWSYVVETYPDDGSAPRRYTFMSDPSFYDEDGVGHGKWA